eukprot:1118378-Prorocentrum_minimum.AAC.2
MTGIPCRVETRARPENVSERGRSEQSSTYRVIFHLVHPVQFERQSLARPSNSRVTRWLDKVLTVSSTVSVSSPVAGFPASDRSVVKIYPRFLRLEGHPAVRSLERPHVVGAVAAHQRGEPQRPEGLQDQLLLVGRHARKHLAPPNCQLSGARQPVSSRPTQTEKLS